MRPTVSLLLGSGFSIPEGLPSVKTINNRLSKIDESEILIHSDQTAIFLNGQTDPNRRFRRHERLFLQEFLEYYNERILPPGKEFNYETFYDFYTLYLFDGQNKDKVEDFYNDFGKRHVGSTDKTNCRDRVSAFNKSFNQLLASLLHKSKYLQDVSYTNYPPYDAFWKYLSTLLTTHDVKVHTLNHDLFFDCIGQHHSDLFQHYSDGYQLEGSPFYGILSHTFNYSKPNEVIKTYHVKLERFTDKFNTPLCLFKLHGSILNTIVHTSSGSIQEVVRIKNNYGISQYRMEHVDPTTGLPKMFFVLDEVSPDFLSGTTNKIRYYTKDPYYTKLLGHFKDNLNSSEQLVVIGYGFQDTGINEFIENEFLSKGKKMVVIDPNKPSTDLIDKYSCTFLPKGVTQVGYQEYKQLIPAH